MPAASSPVAPTVAPTAFGGPDGKIGHVLFVSVGVCLGGKVGKYAVHDVWGEAQEAMCK